jgi:hypothetical protein
VTRVPDAAIAEVRDRGFTIVEGFLPPDTLAEVQAAMAEVAPTASEYHADPARYTHLVEGQFSGNFEYPFGPIGLDRLAYHPDLVDVAERFLGTADLDLYKVEFWAKYSGATDYDQSHHRDYGNHNLLVPRADRRWPQMTTFILLSDVTDQDGPTMVVPRELGDRVPLHERIDREDRWGLREHEVPVIGPAGTLFVYTTDVIHRASAITGAGRARFALLADYKARGAAWLGKRAWGDSALHGWDEIMADCSPRERELFGIPPPGHEYWNDQTIHDVAKRWPGWDMGPYEEALR